MTDLKNPFTQHKIKNMNYISTEILGTQVHCGQCIALTLYVKTHYIVRFIIQQTGQVAQIINESSL